jgi:hypothetical protein
MTTTTEPITQGTTPDVKAARDAFVNACWALYGALGLLQERSASDPAGPHTVDYVHTVLDLARTARTAGDTLFAGGVRTAEPGAADLELLDHATVFAERICGDFNLGDELEPLHRLYRLLERPLDRLDEGEDRSGQPETGTTVPPADRPAALAEAARLVVRAAEVVRADDTGDPDLLARLRDRVRELAGMMWEIQGQDPKPPAPAGWDDDMEVEAALDGLPTLVLAIEHCIEHPDAHPVSKRHSEGWYWCQSGAVGLARSVVAWAEKHEEGAHA